MTRFRPNPQSRRPLGGASAELSGRGGAAPSRRRGMSTLVAVMGLLSVCTFVGIFQFTLSKQAASDVHRIQLSAMARIQARSAIQELLAQANLQCNQPGTPLFRMLREVMDEAWESKDVTDLLRAPAIALKPGWGRRTPGGDAGRAAARVLEHTVRIRGSRSAKDVRGSEEWVGVLTISVVAELADSIASVRRQIEESYEIRTVLLAPPRPFDQLGLFLGRHDAAVDAPRVNAARERLLASQKRLWAEMQQTKLPGLTPETAERLKAIVEGMLPPEEVARRTPVLPEEPSALWGFYHTGRYYLDGLNLIDNIEKTEVEIARYEAEARASQADPEKLVEALYHLVDEHSDAVNLIWEYMRIMNVHPLDSETYRANVEPYLSRLTPEYFLDRSHLRIHPDDPVFRRWLVGKSRLEGVLDLRGLGRRLTLKGDLHGRLVLIVGEHGAELEDLNPRTSLRDSRVVVVSLGGDVDVRGTSHASILMLGTEAQPTGSPGRVRVPYSAILKGNLIVPNPTRGALQLEGSIMYDARLIAAYPPKETLNKAFRGDYLVAISPLPIFAEGRAQ